MNIETKAKISKVTLSLLAFAASIFLVGILVLVLCAGLQINPFKETTTGFLIASFIGLIGISAILVLLNVATNISLIADAKIAELHVVLPEYSLRKWAITFIAIALIIVGFIFGGNYISKEKYIAVVQLQAEEILKENSDLLENISTLLSKGKPEDFKKIYEIRDFLEKQRRNLPELTLIYSSKFEGKLALYQIQSYFDGDVEKNKYNQIYFTCTKDFDCDYLKGFFSGQMKEALQKYSMRDEQFYIYIPFIGKNSRFVLLFERRNSYGKIGS